MIFEDLGDSRSEARATHLLAEAGGLGKRRRKLVVCLGGKLVVCSLVCLLLIWFKTNMLLKTIEKPRGVAWFGEFTARRVLETARWKGARRRGFLAQPGGS